MDFLSRYNLTVGSAAETVTKQDLRAVVDALVDELEGALLGFNAAIPQPQRARLSIDVKAYAFILAFRIILKRNYGVDLEGI